MVADLPTKEAEVYGRFAAPLSKAELERFFFLDDADKQLVSKRRGDRNRVGFALQLGTVRFLGTFLADPTDVPTEVVDYVAQQVRATDASSLKGYLSRRATRFEHTAEIMAAYGYRGLRGLRGRLGRLARRPGVDDGRGPDGTDRWGGPVVARASCAAPGGEPADPTRRPGP